MNLDLDGAERVEDEDREDIQENIKEASKQGDLSPRHVNQLNKGKRSSKIVFWNIRSVNTQNSFERLTDLKRRNKYAYIALLEPPFQGPQQIDEYEKKLKMENVVVNLCKNMDFLE